jgi:hypothetical protein
LYGGDVQISVSAPSGTRLSVRKAFQNGLPIAPLDPAHLHTSFCAVEAQIEAANVSVDSYGVIDSPDTRNPKLHKWINSDLGRDPLRSKLARSYPRKSVRRMLEQHNVLLVGSRRRTLIDAVTLALNNQVKIYANLLCDVAVRYPAGIRGHRAGHLRTYRFPRA